MKPIVKPGRVMNPGFPTRVFDDLFFNGINRFWGSDQCDEIPAVNISKTEDGYTIEFLHRVWKNLISLSFVKTDD